MITLPPRATKPIEALLGSPTDFDDGLPDKGFAIQNPNAQRTCGYRKSFS